MVNYGIPVWKLVLEAAKELTNPFTSAEVIRKIRETNPNVKSETIRCHVIGMTPNHPSSKHYPSLRENHPAFNYVGNGQFELPLNNRPEQEDASSIRVTPNLETPTWREVAGKIEELKTYIEPFKIEFLDRDSFKSFCDNLSSNLTNMKDVCLTGYFSETIRAELEKITQNNYYHVRLISPDFHLGTPREKKNLEALRKLSKSGAEIRFNYRIHARLLVASNPLTGLLVLGSFDYNTECIGKERYDAGIKTSHPDLVKSALNFFEQVWKDSETQTLEQFSKEKKVA